MLDRDDAYVMIIGDLNARTGQEQVQEQNEDYGVNFDSFMDVSVTDSNYDTCRVSKDSIINNFGRSLLEFCFSLDLRIMNGFCAGDADGSFTFISPGGSSVIDYVVVSHELTSNCDLCVGDALYSWHLPVTLRFETSSGIVREAPVVHEEEKVVWSEEFMQL